MAVDTKIAERLKEARLAAGYESAAEAADVMDLPFSTYAGHENGSRGMRSKSLTRYASFFKVSLAWLAEGKYPMRGKETEAPGLLDGLPPEGRQQVLEFIDFVRAKYGV